MNFSRQVARVPAKIEASLFAASLTEGSSMGVHYKDAKKQVLKRVRHDQFQEMLDAVKKMKAVLWGVEQRRDFDRRCLIWTLYKDIKGVGYHTLIEDTKDWMPATIRSVRHNTHSIRKTLGNWARKKISLGDYTEWKNAARNVRKSAAVEEALFSLDSSDFRLKGRRTVSRKDRSWSFKEDSPAQRFQFLTDLQQRVRRVWGPLSPKLYDGDFMETVAEWFDSELGDVTVLGDCHYRSGAKHLQSVNLVTPTPDTKQTKRGVEEKLHLTKKQKRENRQIRALRARIEPAIGDIKNTFEALSLPWYEDPEQQRHLVFISTAVHNDKVGRRRRRT